MRLLAVMAWAACPQAQEEPLKERIEQILPRLVCPDEGARLAAQMELRKLGEAAVVHFPADADSELDAALDQVRRLIAQDQEIDRLEMCLRVALDQSCRVWKRLVEVGEIDAEQGDLFERGQHLLFKIELIKADLQWVRDGVLDMRERLLRKLRTPGDVRWVGFQPRSWSDAAAVISDVLDAPVRLSPELSSSAATVAMEDPAATLEELLDGLTRRAGVRCSVAPDGLMIR
jgi:hypothetical protein